MLDVVKFRSETDRAFKLLESWIEFSEMNKYLPWTGGPLMVNPKYDMVPSLICEVVIAHVNDAAIMYLDPNTPDPSTAT